MHIVCPRLEGGDQIELEDAQVNDIVDLGRVFPDLQMTSAQNFYNPALTVYIDGGPQFPVVSLQSLMEVERAELLKEPQGTLYGKSALSGVLNTVTRQPDSALEAHVKTGLGNRGSYQAQAALSGP